MDNNTKKRCDYFADWLEHYQAASQVAPAVREALDDAEWELSVLRDCPQEAMNISTAQLDQQAGQALDRIRAILPPIPEYGFSTELFVNSINTSSTSASVSYVQRIGLIGTPEAGRFCQTKIEEYRALQESHQRPQRVRALLSELTPDLLDRFEVANQAVAQCRVGVAAKTAAASELRNLVDGLQGHLFQKVRQFPNEKVTWNTAADRLFSPGSTAAATLMTQAEVRNTLYDDLSDATKDREGSRPVPIEALSARVLDHLFAVLSLLKSVAPV